MSARQRGTDSFGRTGTGPTETTRPRIGALFLRRWRSNQDTAISTYNTCIRPAVLSLQRQFESSPSYSCNTSYCTLPLTLFPSFPFFVIVLFSLIKQSSNKLYSACGPFNSLRVSSFFNNTAACYNWRANPSFLKSLPLYTSSPFDILHHRQQQSYNL